MFGRRQQSEAHKILFQTLDAIPESLLKKIESFTLTWKHVTHNERYDGESWISVDVRPDITFKLIGGRTLTDLKNIEHQIAELRKQADELEKKLKDGKL